MKEKRMKQIFISVFILMLVVPMVLTDFKQDVRSDTENRMLANFPKLYTAEGELNPSFISEFETWFNDHVGFRERLFSGNLKIQYNIFENSANANVLAGKDGWLFYMGGNNVDIASGEYPGLGEKELEKICRNQISIQEKLKKQGMEYVILIPPSKVSIYPEFIRGDFAVRETPADILAEYLESHSDIKVVRMKDALLEEKERSEELLFFKTDTHWNAYGSSTAYKYMVNQLQEWGFTDSEAADITLIKEETTRDLSTMLMGDVDAFSEESYSDFVINNPSAALQKSGEINEYLQNYVKEHNIFRVDYYENVNKEMPSYLVFGDSMFISWMGAMLAENCSALTAIQKPEISQEMINVLKPNVVFLELGERFIGDMASDDFNSSFLHVTIERQDKIVDIEYKDDGQYQHMWFPVWSNENGGGDIIWHEAERTDPDHWHVAVNLDDYGANGVYNVHFYQSEDTLEHAENVHIDSFHAGELFNHN